jgi:hypothetical protein
MGTTGAGTPPGLLRFDVTVAKAGVDVRGFASQEVQANRQNPNVAKPK